MTEQGQFSLYKDQIKESEIGFAAGLKRPFFSVQLSHVFFNVTLDKQVNLSFSLVNNNVEVLLPYNQIAEIQFFLEQLDSLTLNCLW